MNLGASASLRPGLPGPLVPRQRLSEAVLSTAPGRCCLVTAPRGYGASTVVADALADYGDRVSWVRVAGAQDEVQALLAVRAAARRIATASGADVAGPRWLVVDGVPRNSLTVWEELAGLLRRMPPWVRLAVTTPHRPPPQWASLGPENGSVHLDAAAVAFTADEAVLLLQAWSPTVGVETLSAVLEQAEGWAMALAAAGACARTGRLDEGWLPRAGAAQLFASWLSALPPASREMLLASSVLDLLSPQVVESVTGDVASAQRLEDLHDMLGHLTEVAPPAGHGDRWWRRHPLLTAALRQQSLHDRRRRHSLAADWYAGSGDVHRTIHHLVQAGRSGEAGEFLMQHHRRMFEAGRAREVLDLCRMIAPGAGSGVQQLLLLGWGQALSGLRAEAALTLETLQEQLGATAGDRAVVYPSDDPALGSWDLVSAQADLLRAYLAGDRADPATMVEYAGRAVAVLRHQQSTESAQTAWITLLRGLIWSAQFDRSRDLLQRMQDVPFPNDVIRESTLVPLQALQLAVDGDVRRASSLVSRTRTWIRQHGMDPWSSQHFSVLVAEATLACETGDPQHAAELAGRIIERATEQQSFGAAVAAFVLRARCRWALGDFPAAQRDLAAGRELAQAQCPDSALLGPLGLAQVTLHMAVGDLARAQQVLAALPPGLDSEISQAAAMLFTQPADAVRMLEGMHPPVPRTRSLRHLLLAAALVGSSRQLAQRHLRQAAAIAHEHGMALLLVEASPQLVQLAFETAAEAPDDALAWALAQRARYAANEPPDPAQRQVRALPPLSRGELQLIALLPSRASNAELAAMLGVSVNTVKTRLRRLYAKLEAGGRDEAIIKAEQRGFIG